MLSTDFRSSSFWVPKQTTFTGTTALPFCVTGREGYYHPTHPPRPLCACHNVTVHSNGQLRVFLVCSRYLLTNANSASTFTSADWDTHTHSRALFFKASGKSTQRKKTRSCQTRGNRKQSSLENITRGGTPYTLTRSTLQEQGEK